MAKLPAFQFYPGDWLKDPNLRRCSHAAKGIWIDMLCLMFESDERGFLVSAGRPWTDREVVCAVGGDSALASAGLLELTTAGVVSVDGRGAYFCRRMVRDEEIRAARARAGAIGGKQNRSKTEANSEAKSGSSDSVSSSASASAPDKTESDQSALGERAEAEAEKASAISFGNRRTAVMLACHGVNVDTPFISELANTMLPIESIREAARKVLSQPNVGRSAAYLRRVLENEYGLRRRRA